MTEPLKQALRELSYNFTTKLTQLNFIILLPMAVAYFLGLFQYQLLVNISIIYLMLSVVYVFSKIPISNKIRQLMSSDDLEKNYERLEDLTKFFQKKTLFNTVFKKKHQNILEALELAHVEFKKLLKQNRKEQKSRKTRK